jgi:hypothetical protein
MKVKYYKILCSILFLTGMGCANLLPSEKRTIQSPWETFNDAKAAFDKIIPYQTTIKDLERLHFDPFTTPNIEILTYLDIIQRFSKRSAIDKEIQNCISAKEACQGYEMNQERISSERYGNPCLDILNFRRKTKKSGWKFNVLIVMENNLVIYKLWSGKPKIDEMTDKKNPLGPLQDMGTWHRIIFQ